MPELDEGPRFTPDQLDELLTRANLTAEQVAAILGFPTRRKVIEMIKAGKLKGKDVTGQGDWLIPSAEVRKLLPDE